MKSRSLRLLAFFCLMTLSFLPTVVAAQSTPFDERQGQYKGEVGALVPTGDMTVRRSAHTATLLPNGKVLMIGGMSQEGDILASAELYDAATESFASTGDMITARVSHAAVLLNDGRVLVVGGFVGRNETASAEIYDPAAEAFTATGSLNIPRGGFTATRLNDGRVLIVGGADDDVLASAEIYDPTTGEFTEIAQMNEAREAHTATLLPDGRVLIVGGLQDGAVLASAEIFDPANGEFSTVVSLNTPRHKHAAVLLQDGTVMIFGGADENDWEGRLSSVEIYEADTNIFTTASHQMNIPRFKLDTAVALLENGQVIVAGGSTQVEIFEPLLEAFLPVENLLDADRFFSTATLLEDGRVLIAGGYDYNIQATTSAWIYAPIS